MFRLFLERPAKGHMCVSVFGLRKATCVLLACKRPHDECTCLKRYWLNILLCAYHVCKYALGLQKASPCEQRHFLTESSAECRLSSIGGRLQRLELNSNFEPCLLPLLARGIGHLADGNLNAGVVNGAQRRGRQSRRLRKR